MPGTLSKISESASVRFLASESGKHIPQSRNRNSVFVIRPRLYNIFMPPYSRVLDIRINDGKTKGSQLGEGY